MWSEHFKKFEKRIFKREIETLEQINSFTHTSAVALLQLVVVEALTEQGIIQFSNDSLWILVESVNCVGHTFVDIYWIRQMSLSLSPSVPWVGLLQQMRFFMRKMFSFMGEGEFLFAILRCYMYN